MRFLLGSLFVVAMSASAAAAPSTSTGATSLVVHLDHGSVRAGDSVMVTLENRGPTSLVVPYAGGSSGCAIPRPQVSLIDSAHRLVLDDSPPQPCLAVMVPPGQVEIAPSSTQVVAAIDTKARKLAPGVYTVAVSFGAFTAPPVTLVVR